MVPNLALLFTRPVFIWVKIGFHFETSRKIIKKSLPNQKWWLLLLFITLCCTEKFKLPMDIARDE